MGQISASVYIPFNTSLDVNSLCSVSARPMAAIAWAVTATIELVLFVMVLVKYRQLDSPNLGSSTSQCNVLDVIARDSSVYFGMHDLFSPPLDQISDYLIT